jgi:RimJ/RimL family protein N-acetyltransferase
VHVIIPVLETARLTLRGPKPEDFAAYAAMWADPETTRHIGDGTPKSTEESWTSFLRHAGHWHIVSFGSWIVEEKASRRAIGVLGFNERKRERATDFDGLPELGWMFDRAASGKGYATEALDAALAWGKEALRPVRVIAIVAPDNAASTRVAEKCGFTLYRRGESLGRSRLFYMRTL